MQIAFFSNFLNHHQAFVADELYRITNDNYTFVETMPMPEWIAKSGYPDYSTKPYLLQAWRDEDRMQQARQLALDADVALFAGFEVLELEKYRISNTNKITFDVSERWLKRGIVNLVSPRILKLYAAYLFGRWSSKPVYKLCSSAFAACDHSILKMYNGRCYKWGYFTEVEDLGVVNVKNVEKGVVRLMWCARFLDFKHPELPVQLAARLKESGKTFRIDMYGTGEEQEKTKALAKEIQVEDVVSFCGNKPNAEILQEMRDNDIFMFTSDKNEGWGAVANEAMSQGCVVVGSNEIGSVPYLIKDGENGLIFQSCDVGSLTAQVTKLIDNPEMLNRLSKKAASTMRELWSPQVAAKNLMTLIEDLSNGRDTSIKEGPCSKT